MVAGTIARFMALGCAMRSGARTETVYPQQPAAPRRVSHLLDSEDSQYQPFPERAGREPLPASASRTAQSHEPEEMPANAFAVSPAGKVSALGGGRMYLYAGRGEFSSQTALTASQQSFAQSRPCPE